jgi:hypothetical protein
MVAVVLVFGLLVTVRASRQLVHRLQNQTRLPSPLSLRSIGVLFLLYILSVVTATWRYSDNIYRPIPYFEPEFMYVKYLWSEMEITFFGFFVLMYTGMKGCDWLSVRFPSSSLSYRSSSLSRVCILISLLSFCLQEHVNAKTLRNSLLVWLLAQFRSCRECTTMWSRSPPTFLLLTVCLAFPFVSSSESLSLSQSVLRVA